MSDDSFGSFIQKNKLAILSTIGVGAAALSAYYYLNQIKSEDSASAGSSSTSKNKKKKHKKKSKSPAPVDKKYPVNSNGSPEITEQYVSSLNEEQKSEISNIVKEEGNEYFKQKDFHKAIEYYTAALAVKEDPIFYSNRSACYVGLEDYNAVVEDTSAALRLKPDYTKCLLRRSNAYEQLEKYEECMFDLTALSVFGGFNNKSVEGVLDRVLRKHSFKIVEKNIIENSNSKQLPSPSSISSFFGAFEKETGESLDLIKESLVPNSGDWFLYEALENLNLQSNEGYENADSYFEQAVKAYEDLLAKPEAHSNVNEVDGSGDDTKEKLSIALEYLGIFQFLKLDPLTSLETINKSLSLFPRPRSYIFNALILADKQEFEKADEMLDKALELTEKHSSEVYYHKAQLFYLRGELVKARENFLKAQELNPDNVYSYIQLACIEYREGDLDKAEQSFKDAKLKFPTSPEIPNYYGEILGDKGDVPNALKQFEIASKLQEALYPRVSVGILPMINKATILLKDPSPENISKSSAILSEAVNLDPKSELAKITLAQLKLQESKVEDAIKLFEEASLLARNLEEKLQATSFAEASKIQLKIKNDPIIGPKMKEIVEQYGIHQ